MSEKIPTYETNEKKLIYVTTGDDPENFAFYVGKEKIGDTTVEDFFETDTSPNSDYLKEEASKRIRQYFGTAGVPYRIDWVELAYRKDFQPNWFRDHQVHEVLKRSGYSPINSGVDADGSPLEFFEIDVETAKKAIKAVKENRDSISASSPTPAKIQLRQEQNDAVKLAKKQFNLKKPKPVLWNAKMRFGKTLAAYQLIKDEDYARVLVMTHRPVVSDSWFEDFKKLNMSESGYEFGSKNKGEKIENLVKKDKFIYFSSIQDLRGSEQVGGKQGYKNQEIFTTEWDLVIVDEAHEGTRTDLSQKVHDLIFTSNTKLLELSGTPFNISDDYEEDQVFTWDYVMEQQAKANWSENHPNEQNPYRQLPKMNMFTFDYKARGIGEDVDGAFNFAEFFRVNDDEKFVHEKEVKQFLDEITKQDDKTNYPFSTSEYRNNLKHSLWLVPSVAAAKVLKQLMLDHEIFGKEYEIVNAVDNGDGVASDGDLEKVRRAIKSKKGKSITLTVRKLTTGINVPEWTAVIFLNNTTSPMSYLQAAFRVQTPYSDENGEKTNAYIFDFAPDRALKIVIEASQFKVAPGKLNSDEQRQKIGDMLNFLPVIGQSGNGMSAYSVDSLVKQLKRVYAEKAVRSGFEDSSLYNDELLKLDGVDIEQFNDLKQVVGTTNNSGAKKIPVNEQGLGNDKEEYEQAENGQKKLPEERTPEEQAAIDKLNASKKQRRAAISILRGISIRIPLMIFGMDADIDEEISIDKFVEKVDDQSWVEFMPKGVTKEKFQQFIKYYDADVFVNAGNIIRRRAKSYEELPYLERTKKITELFSTFKNPDKETVLTPWRVVNMQLVSTLGGLSFYDSDFDNTIDDPYWVDTDVSKEVWQNDKTFLEINSKTGLYPLYVVNTLLQRYVNGNKKATRKSVQDEEVQRILQENVYIIAKTPMAKTITQRAIAGYTGWETNIQYFDKLTDELKNDLPATVEKIGKAFGRMKFDVVVGNPPYQENQENNNKGEAIYNYFYDLAAEISDKYVLISPARFLFNGGLTPKPWNKKMLNDPHLNVEYFEQNSSKIFPNTDIKGGLSIIYRDIDKNFGAIGNFIPNNILRGLAKQFENNPESSLPSIMFGGRSDLKFNDKFLEKYPDSIQKRIEQIQRKNPKVTTLSNNEEYELKSSTFDSLDYVFSEVEPNDSQNYWKILGLYNNNRTYRWINRDYMTARYPNNNNLLKYKVFVPKANGSGAIGEVLSTPLIGTPLESATPTFISIGAFDDLVEAENLLKYIKTKFARMLLGILKITQDNPPQKWKYIPLQDFTSDSDIDWTKTISEIDQQLYAKYHLSQEEINFIETNIKSMD